jgi:CubicO group peptidase (beta-lactamase class C family)
MMHGMDGTTALEAAISAAVDEYRAPGGVPGLALAVTDRDRLLFGFESGFADPAAGRAVHRGTLFEIGSIGKTFTAAVILQLADEGRLGLDDPVVRHLPWFAVPRTGATITIRHLLSHMAGITAGVDGTPEATFQVWRLRDLPPGSGPGRRFHYSNVGYKALGLVIEALEEVSYGEVIRRRLLEAAGMGDSTPTIIDAIRPRLAVGYEPMYSERPWTAGDPIAPAPWLTTGTADGSVAATAVDMVAFVRYLQRDPGGVVARMAVPVERVTGPDYRWGYGYGLATLERDGGTWLGHGGGMVGYLAGMQWDPASGIGAVVLQSGMDGSPNHLARRAVRMVRASREGRDPAGEGPEVWAEGDDDAHDPPASAAVPDADREVLIGTYRSHDPWQPVFRVEARGTALWLCWPAAPDGFEDEQVLVPMARGWWRVGTDRLGPERLRFDTVIDGVARRAWLSGWDYYRTDPDPGP